MKEQELTINQEIRKVMNWVENWKTARIEQEGVYYVNVCKLAPNCAQEIILLALRNYMR
jgi:hypothetical protein